MRLSHLLRGWLSTRKLSEGIKRSNGQKQVGDIERHKSSSPRPYKQPDGNRRGRLPRLRTCGQKEREHKQRKQAQGDGWRANLPRPNKWWSRGGCVRSDKHLPKLWNSTQKQSNSSSPFSKPPSGR